MNNIKSVGILSNNYYAMRHGQSKANVEGIIVSHPENGVKDRYGLTDLGKEQVRISAERSSLGTDTLIFCSDFSRAAQTANIVQKALNCAPPQPTILLRERFFGDLEMQDNANYQKVWDKDKQDPGHTEHGVESVNSVLDRATKLIAELEQTYKDKDILLISHGDCLQILQTGFQKVSSSAHRELEHLKTAEIRQLLLTT
jgi:glucosyl-3-phosphoglycerate phosphatase